MSDEEVSQAEDDEAEGEEWHGFGGVDDDIEGEGKPQEEGTSSAAVSAAPSGKSLDYSAHFLFRSDHLLDQARNMFRLICASVRRRKAGSHLKLN